MPSRLNSLSAEGEAKAEVEVTKEEGEFQVTITQVKVPDIQTRIRISILKEAEGGDQMKKQAYNTTTSKSIGTMGRRKKITTQAEHMSQIMKEKPQMVCFSHATRLKNNTKTFGCWTMDVAIT
jgi:hypothetical protein